VQMSVPIWLWLLARTLIMVYPDAEQFNTAAEGNLVVSDGNLHIAVVVLGSIGCGSEGRFADPSWCRRCTCRLYRLYVRGV
jgi:hypothetical protein